MKSFCFWVRYSISKVLCKHKFHTFETQLKSYWTLYLWSFVYHIVGEIFDMYDYLFFNCQFDIVLQVHSYFFI